MNWIESVIKKCRYCWAHRFNETIAITMEIVWKILWTLSRKRAQNTNDEKQKKKLMKTLNLIDSQNELINLSPKCVRCAFFSLFLLDNWNNCFSFIWTERNMTLSSVLVVVDGGGAVHCWRELCVLLLSFHYIIMFLFCMIWTRVNTIHINNIFKSLTDKNGNESSLSHHAVSSLFSSLT